MLGRPRESALMPQMTAGAGPRPEPQDVRGQVANAAPIRGRPSFPPWILKRQRYNGRREFYRRHSQSRDRPLVHAAIASP